MQVFLDRGHHSGLISVVGRSDLWNGVVVATVKGMPGASWVCQDDVCGLLRWYGIGVVGRPVL